MSAVPLERRLANFRQAAGPVRPPPGRASTASAERLAAVLDAEVVRDPAGCVVRFEAPAVPLPIDRDRLAALPGQPPPDVPLVCLDTETTGLATAAGTLAFLVGLGWWEGDRFRQVQLLLPDQPDEPVLLRLLADHIPARAWLVTYNGRGFDWPLLVARYRLARRDPPRHGGHLDLLPFVRRVFRHRMSDARLRTVEAELLGIRRHGDVEGWEIPGRYLDFLRWGAAEPLVEVVRHNHEDVRSLARLLVHVEADYGDDPIRQGLPAGDLAGLSRAYARERRLGEALACLETALVEGPSPAPPVVGPSDRRPGPGVHEEPWWSPRRPADFGGRPRTRAEIPGWSRLDSPWTEERMLVERARLLRRLGRHVEAAAAWEALAGGPGPVAVLAWIEVAKLREHRLGDLRGALAAVERAWAVVERRRCAGRPDTRTERDLARRGARLRSRLARRPVAQPPAVGGTSGTRGSGDSPSQRSLTASRSGSYEQAIVRRSPASALR